ncbi:MAG: demethylmenaquinone methyltransferase/2-methoxy-6-polyprenyl-1,4-benzoquinol methylase [Ulvibacter sp.]|jgi:demethylmenaquinone methyltransferase/2-methoxy-6-polyprenyl-1,4-benzoquinol methylase
MKKKITPYKNSSLNKKEQVKQMFDTISGNYDNLNRVISLGTDNKWRKKVIKMVADRNPDSILDIATGTGDLAIKFASATQANRIIGLDLSEGMLSMAKKKISGSEISEKLIFVQGDSEALDFEDNLFDVVTVSFGIRNFENLEKGLSEIYRVLKKDGLFVILETSVPTKSPFKQGYHFYSRQILPLIGKLFSKDKVAYSYLSESASLFPFGNELNNILRKNGFIEVENEPQTFGVATIYTATK